MRTYINFYDTCIYSRGDDGQRASESAFVCVSVVVLMVEILKPAINKLLSLFCFIGMNRKQICSDGVRRGRGFLSSRYWRIALINYWLVSLLYERVQNFHQNHLFISNFFHSLSLRSQFGVALKRINDFNGIIPWKWPQPDYYTSKLRWWVYLNGV